MTGFISSTTVSDIGTQLAATISANFDDTVLLIVISLAIPVAFYLVDRVGSSVSKRMRSR